jgi:indole-3-glycerol phosphate synthase
MSHILIAEVKTCSPFGWESRESWDALFHLASEAGDWLSIHTDPRWGGSFQHLYRARKQTNKPILAKGLHETDDEIRAALGCGADYVLVVGRVPPYDLMPKCILEPNSLRQLNVMPSRHRVVWNSRDLTTGGWKKESFQDARRIHGAGWLCQASNIRSRHDVNPKAEAILVGSHLRQFLKSHL